MRNDTFTGRMKTIKMSEMSNKRSCSEVRRVIIRKMLNSIEIIIPSERINDLR